MKLTQEQKDHYVNEANSQCPNPKCKSDDINGKFVQVDAGYCYQPCQCNACGLEWNDIYKLVDMYI